MNGAVFWNAQHRDAAECDVRLLYNSSGGDSDGVAWIFHVGSAVSGEKGGNRIMIYSGSCIHVCPRA